MEDVLKTLQEAGFKPEVIEDDGGFEPVKGAYLCRIASAGRKKGTNEKTGKSYDFRVIKPQVVEIIDGEKATNRYLDSNDLVFNTDEEGTKKLLTVLHTAGIEIKATNDEELDTELETLTDRTMYIRAWRRPRMKKEGDNWVEVEPKEMVQKVKVVKDFSKSKVKPSSIKSDVPF